MLLSLVVCRMKEQLICELVKTGKDAELMNKQYAEKIKALERVWIAAVRVDQSKSEFVLFVLLAAVMR